MRFIQPVFILSAILFFQAPVIKAESLNAYIKVTGARQGLFKGESTRRGHEGTTQIISYSFEVNSPHDLGSGLATGKRQLKPIVIYKNWGLSSNGYLNAITNNELLKEVKILFFSVGQLDRQEFLTRTVTLTDAVILNVKSLNEVNNATDAEAITFFYRKIQVQDASGAIYSDEINQN